MEWLPNLIALVTGLAVGLVVALVLRLSQARTARELLRESEAQRKSDVDDVIEQVKASFGSLSLEALRKSTDEFLKLANQHLKSEREAGARELDAKKGLIDQQLQQMTIQLDKVSKLMNELEQDRVEKFGALAAQLEEAASQRGALMDTTNKLREVLANSRARGQWGERMAEDVLRLAGLQENVNYLKQKQIETTGSRPDFTFLLPNGFKLNMDVKFPMDNYLRYIDATVDSEREKFRNDFLRDVRKRVKEITTRDYIDPEQGTVDCVLLFIPNEQMYAFIHEQDSSLLDDALRNKVVSCSPITLFAVLAVIRQAIDNFALERRSNEMLSLYGQFKKEWEKFVEALAGLGRRIKSVQDGYDSLSGTRRRQLERPLNRIEEIRMQHGVQGPPEIPLESPPADQPDAPSASEEARMEGDDL